MTTEKSTKRKQLMLLDGNAIIHRAFHGVPPLSLGDGTPTNAVYGFVSTLLTVLTKFQPDYIVATFDLPGKTFRHDLYDQYKGTRKEMDEDLKPQFALVKEIVRAMNIEIIEKEYYEADDVIGTLSVQATAEGVGTVIVTGDRDTFQLVDDHVQVFTMSRGIKDMVLYDREAVFEKMGVTVEQVIDYKGICGDSSDNIPGVKGIGDKGATTLLGEYGDLDGVYAHIDEVKGAMQKKLIAQKKEAYLSKDLGTIRTDVDVELALERSLSADIDMDGARSSFQKFQFMSLLKRLDKSRGLDDSDGRKKTPRTVEQKKTDKADSKNGKILNAIEAKEFLGVSEGHQVFCVFDFEQGALRGIALKREDRSVYIAKSKETEKAIELFLTSGRSDLIVYDMKSLWHECHDSGVSLPKVWRDVLLLAYSARTGKKVDLEHLIFDITGEDLISAEDSNQLSLGLRDEQQVAFSLMQRAEQLAQVHDQIAHELDTMSKEQTDLVKDARTVWQVFEELEMPLARVLYDMECAGIAFDVHVFEKISKKTDATLKDLTQKIHTLAGEDFNINSTKQLRVILFEKLNLPTADVKKTKTGFSTASTELEKLRSEHEIISLIETYRELFKLKTTYIDALPKLVAPDGRIHTTYNQAVTSTGRLSSKDPNLQNIPIRSETGRSLRKAFVAKKGSALVSVDYSQIELRCVAHIASDTAMIEAFKNGEDIHSYTVARVLGKEISDVTKEERSRAKELNFGLIYGMGAHSFAKASGLSNVEAKDFIAKYFDYFSGVKQYMDQTKLAAHENGFVETLLGRRYYVGAIASKNAMMRAGAERAAINMPIQGLNAEIMKLAMIAIDEFLTNNYPAGDVRVLLQVHDELILEAPEGIAQEVMRQIKGVMEQVYTLRVPLVADGEVGVHWGEL